MPLSDVSRRQGMLLGRLADAGLPLREWASLAALAEDVVDGAAIEGERLDPASVRSHRLLDGFDGRLTRHRWASMVHRSPDPALRDINELVERGVLRRGPGSGRAQYPWNGRFRALGIEPVAAAFDLGQRHSEHAGSPLRDDGCRTAASLAPDSPLLTRYAISVA